MDTRPPPNPEIEELCARIQKLIHDRRPPDEASLLQSRPDEAAKEVGASLDGAVRGDTEHVKGAYDGLDDVPDGEAVKQAEAMEPIPTTAETPQIDAEKAAPDPIPEKDLSLDEDVQQATTAFKDAGMDTEPAKLVQDGPIADGREGLDQMGELAGQGADDVGAAQASLLAAAQADMSALRDDALATLALARSDTVTGLVGGQLDLVGTEEQKRAQVSQRMTRIFEDAAKRVDGLLTPLPEVVHAKWDAGISIASQQFQTDLSKVKKYVDDRHSGLLGAAVELFDDLFGYPTWIVAAYDRAEQRFADSVCDLLRDISRDVNDVIDTCQDLIGDARTSIEALIEELPEDLKAWAQEEALKVGDKLDGLQQRVEVSRDELNQDIAGRASGSVQEVRETVHALRLKASGALGRIKNAVAEFLKDPGRAIVNGLLKLAGIAPSAFWTCVDRLGEVVDGIADDPIGFANNLSTAVGEGFGKFFDHFPSHMLSGLVEWLFSSLSSVGVQIPGDFSLKNIVSVVLQVLGISWDGIRAKLIKQLGPEAREKIEGVERLAERAFEVVKVLIDQGPMGLVELIKQQLSLENIWATVKDAVLKYLTETLIKSATVRILAMFNPVGAILQAIQAIYKGLTWIFKNAAKLFSMVETVVNGAYDILNGSFGAVAGAIEKALASLISPVIDFVADLLGVGDVPKKIAEFVRGIQQTVDKALDRAIAWIISKAKVLFGIGGDDADSEKKDGEGDPASEDLGTPVTFQVGGETHTLWAELVADEPVLMVASNPNLAEKKVDELETTAKTLDDANSESLVQAANEEVNRASDQLKDLHKTEDKVEKAKAQKAVKKAAATLAKAWALVGKGKHPPPMLCTYGEADPLAGHLPDEKPRHAHHVPEKVTAELFGPSNGSGMSAIWVHEDTHRSIHSTNHRDELVKKFNALKADQAALDAAKAKTLEGDSSQGGSNKVSDTSFTKAPTVETIASGTSVANEGASDIDLFTTKAGNATVCPHGSTVRTFKEAQQKKIALEENKVQQDQKLFWGAWKSVLFTAAAGASAGLAQSSKDGPTNLHPSAGEMVAAAESNPVWLELLSRHGVKP